MPAGLLGCVWRRCLTERHVFRGNAERRFPQPAIPGWYWGQFWRKLAGRKDKLTILADAAWRVLGAWLEQLVAESSGKNNRGLIPVCGEALATTGPHPATYHRVPAGKREMTAGGRAAKHGQHCVTFNLRTPYAVGQILPLGIRGFVPPASQPAWIP